MAFGIEEKRRVPRIRISNPLRFQIRGKPEANHGITDNISTGGIAIISNKFLARATLVMLEFNVLSRILFPIGRITWAEAIPQSDRYRLGIEFMEMANEEKNHLSDFIHLRVNNMGG